MFRALWGEIQTGCLKRLPFLAWLLAVSLAAAFIVFSVSVGIAALEKMAGVEPVAQQLALDQRLGPVGFMMLVLVVALLMMGMLNVMAKRARDVGLPAPWLLVLGWLLLSGLLSSAGGVILSGLLSLIVLLVLLLMPTQTFGSRR
jgi:uncharacterized membrane protein YhaH (DUF805 family)